MIDRSNVKIWRKSYQQLISCRHVIIKQECSQDSRSHVSIPQGTKLLDVGRFSREITILFGFKPIPNLLDLVFFHVKSIVRGFAFFTFVLQFSLSVYKNDSLVSLYRLKIISNVCKFKVLFTVQFVDKSGNELV